MPRFASAAYSLPPPPDLPHEGEEEVRKSPPLVGEGWVGGRSLPAVKWNHGHVGSAAGSSRGGILSTIARTTPRFPRSAAEPTARRSSAVTEPRRVVEHARYCADPSPARRLPARGGTGSREWAGAH